ncbi:MAG: helix-turn-helix domain-containing protein [Leadbetterella sp.]
MSLSPDKIKILFGLKLKQLRIDRNINPSQLAKKSGLSVSYLNEIEKGKKFPKPDKILLLAEVLEVDFRDLSALNVEDKLQGIEQLLASNFLDDVPFDFFGLDPLVIIEMLASSPLRFGTFINSISRLGKSYNLDMGQFYYAILKSYQEVHYNYFEDLEQQATAFLAESKINKISETLVSDYLSKKLGIGIQFFDGNKNKVLASLRSNFNPKSKVLSINKTLSPSQKTFIMTREIGFQLLQAKSRPYTYNYIKVKNFEEILANYKASYFAGAVLVPKDSLVSDLGEIFKERSFAIDKIREQIDKYEVTPETYLQRLISVLNHGYGIKNVGFFKFESNKGFQGLRLLKDLHLNKKHFPQETAQEAYCRRWTGLKAIQELEIEKKSRVIIHQFSKYVDDKRLYWELCIAEKKAKNYSITLSIELSDELASKFKFLDNRKNEIVQVGSTCERCSIFDCKERSAAPKVLQEQREENEFEMAIKKFF